MENATDSLINKLNISAHLNT